MEDMMKQYIKNMSTEDKQKMMSEFIASMSHEEKKGMAKQMMPNMFQMMTDLGEDDCKAMMAEMSPEVREQCGKMMANCLKMMEA